MCSPKVLLLVFLFAFFSLPLIFTLVAASISLFLTANFHVFLPMKFVSFLGFIFIYIDVFVNGKQLSNVDCATLLGVEIDSKLSFDEHIEKLCKKLASRIAILRKIRACLPLTVKPGQAYPPRIH